MKKLLCSIKGASGNPIEFYDDGTYLTRLGISRWYIDDNQCLRYAHDKRASMMDFLHWGLSIETSQRCALEILNAIAAKALEENVLS